MANLMHKLIKSKPSLRITTALNTTATTTTLQQQPFLITAAKPQDVTDPTKPLLNLKTTDTSQFFPNYPFGYLLNPISSTGFDPLKLVVDAEDQGEGEGEDARTVWADSVKKKRKRKMNKHKYKKLRKRLRRKAN